MDATVARRLLTGGALLVLAFGAVLVVLAVQWPRGDLRFTLGTVTAAVVGAVLVPILLATVHRWRRATVVVPVVAAVEIASLVATVYVAFVMATATP